MIPLAVLLALLAACLFAAAVSLQHSAVRGHDAGGELTLRGLAGTVRSRGWLTGTGFAILGSGLHVLALALAPMVIVQPLGVLSLVLTVVFTARARRQPIAPPVRLAVFAVCGGVFGFVALAVSPAVVTSVVVPGAVHLAALGALLVAVVGLRVRGQGRCAVLAASAAVLFGLGSVLTKSATGQLFTADPQWGGLLFAAEAGLLLAVGGWVMHQAYAAGPTAVVVGAITVLDPLTAVSTGLLLYGEAAYLTPATAVGQAALALLAVGGVVVLARSVPDQREVAAPEEQVMPARRTGSGLRIVLGADTFPPDVNGAANFAGRLAHGLAGRGHDVHVICPSPTGEPGTVTDGGITIHHLPSVRTPFHPDFRISLPWQTRKAADLLAGLDPDVVHVQSHFPVGRAVLRAATARQVPTVATNHFMPENLFGYLKIPAALRRSLARLGWRDLVRVYREAGIVTAPTPRAVNLLTANHFPGKPRAISCGIDIEHYAAPRVAKSTVDTSVLFVGRLDAEKNVHELIHAVSRIPGLRAELVGDGFCRTRLESLAAELGVTDRVRFHGVVSDEDLVQAYRRNDIFCMPGTAELQSLATMEAMAAGLPVVAADAMALPHLVHPGVNGHLYPPADLDALTGHLAELAADPDQRAAMGEASEKLITRHALEATLATFEQVYAELVRPHAPTPVLTGAA
ncbi:glycosyltransferase [Crossiella cryophila]|uniref:Glycosyltransferase involved in cell wall biosynthesis n=1 Tax=Crossiella cryophila TaxID=43355 RepID=A0A7W7CFS0_9PSEU|nr:glycosyltransferase [Crossiella cryophila]MBB4680383.1 glycosyltransferase involved in cell wall biosynthesis [Crossiella cryophila]